MRKVYVRYNLIFPRVGKGTRLYNSRVVTRTWEIKISSVRASEFTASMQVFPPYLASYHTVMLVFVIIINYIRDCVISEGYNYNYSTVGFCAVYIFRSLCIRNNKALLCSRGLI